MPEILILGLGFLILIGTYFVFFRKKDKLIKFGSENSETIDGELHIDDIVGFFKLQNLDSQKDMPFIATEKFMTKYAKYEKKEGYILLFCGKTDENADSVTPLRLFYAKKFDDKIEELISSDDFVVLE